MQQRRFTVDLAIALAQDSEELIDSFTVKTQR